jgi:hypothetical protein
MVLKVVERIELKDIPDNFFCLVNMTTQAGFTIEVEIVNSGGERLFYAQRTSTDVLPIISEAFYALHTPLYVNIRCDQSASLDIRYEPFPLRTDTGILISQSYEFVMEDWTDADYNDLWLTIRGWRTKG